MKLPSSLAHFFDVKREARGGALGSGIPAEGVLGLGHADGQVCKAQLGEPLDALLGLLRVLHAASAIHLLGNDLDLFLPQRKDVGYLPAARCAS